MRINLKLVQRVVTVMGLGLCRRKKKLGVGRFGCCRRKS
jgi:hypothetical protein